MASLQPERISSYFFAHLANAAPSHAAAPDVPASSSSSSSSSSPPLATPVVTRDAAVDAALWQRYTPETYKAAMTRHVAAEQARTAELKAQLEEAWQAVEAQLRRNAARRAELASEELSLQSLQATLAAMSFWDEERMAAHFDLALPSAMAGENAAADDADAALLDPGARPHPLRRLFAPLLQRRAQLPPDLHILLTELQKLQAGELAGLERRMGEVAPDGVTRGVPLHRPLRPIATLLQRDVSRLSCHATATAMETSETAAFRAIAALPRALDAYVAEACGDDPARLAQLAKEERFALSEKMWRLLLDELVARQRRHTEAMSAYNVLTAEDARLQGALRAAIAAGTSESAQSMSQLTAQAEAQADFLGDLSRRTRPLMAQIAQVHEREAGALRAAIARRGHELDASAAAQEKLARRVRQLLKELHSEQSRYAALTQALLQDRLSLAQLEASHGQLLQSLQSCHAAAAANEARVRAMREDLRSLDAVRQAMLRLCTQHAGRLHTDLHYRRRRLAGQILGNVQHWYRCLQDIGGLYEERLVRLEAKAQSSWQLNYLTAAEREWAMGNLLDYRRELTTLQDEYWPQVKKLCAEVHREDDDEDVGEDDVERQVRLDGAEYGETATAAAAAATDDEPQRAHVRELMCLLDGDYRVQHQNSTLRSVRAASGKAHTITTTAAVVPPTDVLDDAAVAQRVSDSVADTCP